jgi:hypothetical protein
MTNDAPARRATNQRGVRYGEVLAVFAEGDRFVAHVYGTQLLNDCPPELWDALDATAIAHDLGALFVKLNGPRYWMIDALGSKGEPIEPVLREFGGILMRRIAVLELGDHPSQTPYTVRHVDRQAIFFFDAGSIIYELTDENGLTYVLQAYCVAVDKLLSQFALGTLKDRLQLPDGWTFSSRILEHELVIDTSATIATVVQDELENTYTLPC